MPEDECAWFYLVLSGAELNRRWSAARRSVGNHRHPLPVAVLNVGVITRRIRTVIPITGIAFDVPRPPGRRPCVSGIGIDRARVVGVIRVVVRVGVGVTVVTPVRPAQAHAESRPAVPPASVPITTAVTVSAIAISTVIAAVTAAGPASASAV